MKSFNKFPPIGKTKCRDIRVKLNHLLEKRPKDYPTAKIIDIHRLSDIADPLCYPLLFPHGEAGWNCNMKISNIGGQKRTKLSRREYITYKFLSIRNSNSLLCVHFGKLFQRFIVDAYVKVEGDRLYYLRSHQPQLRTNDYAGLLDYVQNAADRANVTVGRSVILPSTYVGGPRAVQQNYQDAMAIVAKYGKPDLFITFTCNPKWDEVIKI